MTRKKIATTTYVTHFLMGHPRWKMWLNCYSLDAFMICNLHASLKTEILCCLTTTFSYRQERETHRQARVDSLEEARHRSNELERTKALRWNHRYNCKKDALI